MSVCHPAGRDRSQHDTISAMFGRRNRASRRRVRNQSLPFSGYMRARRFTDIGSRDAGLISRFRFVDAAMLKLSRVVNISYQLECRNLKSIRLVNKNLSDLISNFAEKEKKNG